MTISYLIKRRIDYHGSCGRCSWDINDANYVCGFFCFLFSWNSFMEKLKQMNEILLNLHIILSLSLIAKNILVLQLAIR